MAQISMNDEGWSPQGIIWTVTLREEEAPTNIIRTRNIFSRRQKANFKIIILSTVAYVFFKVIQKIMKCSTF